jgi:hypothetical protein
LADPAIKILGTCLSITLDKRAITAAVDEQHLKAGSGTGFIYKVKDMTKGRGQHHAPLGIYL